MLCPICHGLAKQATSILQSNARVERLASSIVALIGCACISFCQEVLALAQSLSCRAPYHVKTLIEACNSLLVCDSDGVITFIRSLHPAHAYTAASGSSVYCGAISLSSCPRRTVSRSAAHRAELTAAVKRNSMLNGGTSCRKR